MRRWMLAAVVLVTPMIVEAAEGVSTADAKKIAAAIPSVVHRPPKIRKLLVYTRTKGFRHSSIPHGALAIRLLGDRTGAFRADVTEDPEAFAPANLSKYDAVLMLNTTGGAFLGSDPKTDDEKDPARVRDRELKASLSSFVRGGKGLAGIHAATDTCYEWAEYGRMIGGFFLNHPWHELVGVKVEKPGHPVCAAFGGKDFEITDEIYQFKAPYSRRNVTVLLSLDRVKTPQKGQRPDDDYAISWIRSESRGRVFYCSLGHREEIYWNPAVLHHYLDGLRYVLGDLAAPATPDSAAADDPADPFVGEYAGNLVPAKGKPAKASAKVFATGWGKYRAVVESGKARAELDGELSAGRVTLGKPAFDQYVTDWEVAGPFTRAGVEPKALFDEPFAPETGGEAAWKKVAAAGSPPAVNLSEAVKGDDRVAYLRAAVTSAVAQEAVLALGSDDGIKVWLNGVVVHANNVMRALKPGDDTVTVKLKEGRNDLLLKVTQGGGGWEACAAVTPKGGGAVTGVRGPAAGETVWDLALAKDGSLTGSGAGGALRLAKAPRVSPTLNELPPKGAIVLLPAPTAQPSLAEWDHQRWTLAADRSYEVGGGDLRTKRDFRNIKRLHVEFMCPVEPDGAGQDRGNSGVYFLDRYEVQVLDSFGKAPEEHECAAIYNTKAVSTNAGLPPGEWQTYDIAFTAPVLNADGTIKTPAKFREVKWNGVVVHRDVVVWKQTGGGSDTPAETGPLRLQDHGHPVRYRNVWVVEGK